MDRNTFASLPKSQGSEIAEEIIGILNAISVVSKRMAKKLALLEERSARKDGGKHNEQSRRLSPNAD